MYPLLQFMHISEENETLANICFLGNNLKGHIQNLTPLKTNAMSLYMPAVTKKHIYFLCMVYVYAT